MEKEPTLIEQKFEDAVINDVIEKFQKKIGMK